MNDCNTWNGRGKIWNDSSNLTWNDKIICDNFFIALDGGGPDRKRIPRKKLKKKINELSEKDKEKFITIYCKIANKDIKSTQKVNKKIDLTVENIQFIIKEVSNINIEIL